MADGNGGHVEIQFLLRFPLETFVVALAAFDMAADAHIEAERKNTLIRSTPRYPQFSPAVYHERVYDAEIGKSFRIHVRTLFLPDDPIVLVHEVEVFVYGMRHSLCPLIIKPNITIVFGILAICVRCCRTEPENNQGDSHEETTLASRGALGEPLGALWGHQQGMGVASVPHHVEALQRKTSVLPRVHPYRIRVRSSRRVSPLSREFRCRRTCVVPARHHL